MKKKTKQCIMVRSVNGRGNARTPDETQINVLNMCRWLKIGSDNRSGNDVVGEMSGGFGIVVSPRCRLMPPSLSL